MPKPYPVYSMKSGWNALLPHRESRPALASSIDTDVTIIGAGYTGLACARRWQELVPGARIAVLDASEVGEGNPGRNSGFLLEIALADDADPDSTGRMEQCNQLTQAAMQSIVADVKACAEPVDLERAGTYRAAASEAGLKALRAYKAFLEAAELPHRFLSQDELRSEIGTEFYQAALYSPDCYLAQPAAVIRAIADRLPHSIDLFENTPVTKLQKNADTWEAETPSGLVRSRVVVLANNSFARELGFERSRLAAVYTYAGLTEPLAEDVQDELGSNRNWGVLPTHRLGSTLRRTRDGRLLVRSLHDYEREGSPQSVRRALQERLWRRFPNLAGQDFEHVWGGAVGFTYNSAPVWGEISDGLFAACGCNGGGTVKGTLFGRLLAELANGKSVPEVPALFGSATWMPPEPLRGIGFRARSMFESWQGRQEL